MPAKADGWKDQMKEVDRRSRPSRNDSRASYNIRNVYFMDDVMHEHDWFIRVPKYSHMLQVSINYIFLNTLKLLNIQFNNLSLFFAACLPIRKLHKTRTIRQMFPQSRKSDNTTQSIFPSLFKWSLHFLSRAY